MADQCIAAGLRELADFGRVVRCLLLRFLVLLVFVGRKEELA
jgi:hypothetical protein